MADETKFSAENVKLVRSPNMKKKLEKVVYMFDPKGKTATLRLLLGGGSYTDGKNITIGASEFFGHAQVEIMFNALFGTTIHEVEHNISSDFDSFKKFQLDLGAYYAKRFKKYKVSKQFGVKIGRHFLNSVEDGRIERIAGARTPGFKKILRANNLFIWDLRPCEAKMELDDFLWSLTFLSIGKAFQKDFALHYGGSECEDKLKEVYPLIEKGVNGNLPQVAVDACWDIVYATEDYFEKFLEEAANDPEKQQQLDDYINEMDENPDFSGGEGKEFKEGDGDGEEGEGQAGDEDGEGSESGEEDGEDGEKQSKKMKNPKHSPPKGDEKPEPGKGVEHDPISPEELEKAIREELERNKERLESESAEEIEAMHRKDLKDEKKERAENGPTLTDKEISELESLYKADRDSNKFKEVKPKEFMKKQFKLPSELKKIAQRYEREINQLLKNRFNVNLRNLTSGTFDARKGHKIISNNFAVFKRKEIPKSSTAVFFLKDGSGSMHGENKERYAGEALAVLEEVFKEHVAMKISTFATTSSYTVHYTEKDWTDKTSKEHNYAYNGYKNRSANGGNKDGFSIRVAVKELMNRKEDHKILFILSDGLPTNYTGGEAMGMSDVRDAVSRARKAGIIVVPIMFGNAFFREEYRSKYEYMYQKHMISVEPDQVMKELVKILKKVILK